MKEEEETGLPPGWDSIRIPSEHHFVVKKKTDAGIRVYTYYYHYYYMDEESLKKREREKGEVCKSF